MSYSPLNGEKMCRICLDYNDPSKMFSPCLCSGHSKYVHYTCLEEWRILGENPEAKTRCFECNFEYKIINIDQNPHCSNKLMHAITQSPLGFVFCNLIVISIIASIVFYSDKYHSIRDFFTTSIHSNLIGDDLIPYFLFGVCSSFSLIFIMYIITLLSIKNKNLFFKYMCRKINIRSILANAMITTLLFLVLDAMIGVIYISVIFTYFTGIHNSVMNDIKNSSIRILDYQERERERERERETV